METFLSRLGVLGVSILVGALLLGGAAGGVAVYRLAAAPQASTQQDQSDHENDHKKAHGHGDQGENDQGD